MTSTATACPIAVAGTPAHGSLSLIGAVATYTPDANYHGPDSFTFTVYDGTVTSASATVSITVNSAGGIQPVAGRIRPHGGPGNGF